MTLADRVVILNKGRIEQVGTPMDVYAAPANLFVAGFIGTPAMNMIPAEIASDGSTGARIVAQGMSLPVDPRQPIDDHGRQKRRLRDPSRGHFARGPPLRVRASIEAPVVTVEPLGAEHLLCFTVGANELIAKIAGRALPHVGERLRFAFNMAHAHLFDAATDGRCGLGVSFAPVGNRLLTLPRGRLRQNCLCKPTANRWAGSG
jgi:ABC-type sugar transport system ATPase subunit